MLAPRQTDQRGAIFAPNVDDAALQAVIADLRRQGQRVCMELPGQSGSAQEMGCDRILERGDDTWQIKTL